MNKLLSLLLALASQASEALLVKDSSSIESRSPPATEAAPVCNSSAYPIDTFLWLPERTKLRPMGTDTYRRKSGLPIHQWLSALSGLPSLRVRGS